MVKTREIPSHFRPIRPGERPALPRLDKDLTYYQEGIRWNFTNGRILLNGRDVNRLISEPATEVATWMGIASGLDEYRKKILSEAREQDQFTRFEAVINALLGKIFGRLKKVYDQKTSGLSWTIENGQLILNGINIREFLARYRLNRNDKAKKFLEGMKDKLLLLFDNPDNEKIRGTIQDLHDELEATLVEKTARPLRPAGPRRPLGL